jgi:hypothetical protein
MTKEGKLRRGRKPKGEKLKNKVRSFSGGEEIIHHQPDRVEGRWASWEKDPPKKEGM